MSALDPLANVPATSREVALAVTRAVAAAGGRTLIVGGCVRDALLGESPREVDLEVHGLALDRLEPIVAGVHACRRVGRSFEILHLGGAGIDVSIAAATSDPESGLREAAARRDFTVNAIAIDAATGACIDPFDGRTDLARRRLRHTSARFVDDPLRVLRGMQLVARFGLTPLPETVKLCAGLTPEGIPTERIFGEWRKLVVDGIEPARGLRFLESCGWLRHYPELQALVGCPQDPRWHPEGDVWTHTLHCMDAFASERIGDAEEDLIVGLAVLCHDLGKPAHTTHEEGRVRSLQHDVGGVAPTHSLLARISTRTDLETQIVPLVAEHLRPSQLYAAEAGAPAVRRLAQRVGRIDRLVRVARADHRGRPPIDEPFEAGAWLLERARPLGVESAAPKRLVQGRHLLALGAEPGPALGAVLERCFEAQLDGRFADVEEGLEYARGLLARS